VCHFICLTLPADADAGAARAILERHGRRLEPVGSGKLVRALDAREQAYYTCKDCDCGTSLGHQPPDGPPRTHDREEAKLRRAGWSEAKIRRRREQQAAAAAHQPRPTGPDPHEVAVWRAIVGELLAAGVRRVGLVVHWASDRVEPGPVVARAALDATLPKLEENRLYRFV